MRVLQVAENVEAELVPNSGHTFAEDNPAWVGERLARFFAPSSRGQFSPG